MKYFLLRSAFISFENILRSSVNYWVLIGLLSDNVWFLIPKNAKTFQKSGFNIFRVQRSSFSVYFNNLIKSAEYNLPKKSKKKQTVNFCSWDHDHVDSKCFLSFEYIQTQFFDKFYKSNFRPN
jgi:hypothetical protein